MKKSILLLALFFAVALSFAQKTGVVRGFVYDKETGEPIIFTNVYLQGTTMGASTDVNGYFSITKVPEGNYTLMTSFLGYDTLRVPITVKAGEILTKQLYLSQSTIQLQAFEVSAEQQEAQTEVRMSVTKITPKEIQTLPTVGGEADLAQYLQVLPGIVFTGDQGGQLYIRGGSPIQNKVLLDGMVIYNPFHSIGLFSVIETDIIRNADIYTGGFGAQFGGRVSSIMDITTKDGNKKDFSGKVSANTFGSSVLIEGPIVKQKENGGGSTSFIFSAKTSYLEHTSQALYKYLDNSTDTNFLFQNWEAPPSGSLPFGFTDIYGKLTFNGGNGSKLNVFGFNFNDRVNYQAVEDLHWTNSGAGTNFIIVPGTSPVLVEGRFSYSSYNVFFKETGADPRTSSISGFTGGFDFTNFVGDNALKYGIELNGFSTDYQYTNAVGAKIVQQENNTQIGSYITYKFIAGKFVFDPGFRLQYYASLNEVSPEPRLGVKYNVTNKFRLKFAGGRYSQNLISGRSDRDVVNFFYGFLSSPRNLQKEMTLPNGNTREVKHPLQTSWHAIVGSEIDLHKNLSLNIETYYKKFDQLVSINRNKIFDDDAAHADVPDVYKKDFIVETGDAYGIDFNLKYEYKRLYLWGVYSLSKVTRWDGITNVTGENGMLGYYPVFDRRHNVNLMASYTFGEDLNWEFNARWNLGSGFPFTQTQGFYEKFDFQDVNQNYVTSNGQLGTLYADLNQGRLPYYHRLDMNIKHIVTISESSTLDINFGITNVYNRENIFYFDRVNFQ
ncbi:MAG: TonB-dependent receptor, partial [Bacteroidetes bacterium]